MKPILITGASRGLGAALAEELAGRAEIIAVARTVGALEELDDRIKARGGKATLAPMDINKPDAMAQLSASIKERWGGLSMWVHAAIHAAPLGPAPDMGQKDFEKSLATNLTASAMLMTVMAPLMDRDGHVVFFDDPHVGQKFTGIYGSTKAGQIALVKSWQAESARIGPHVHLLTPPPMPTATRARFYPGEDRSALTPCTDAAKELLSQINLGDG